MTISNQAEWILEFANLGRKPGVLNLPTPKALDRVKRKPDFSKLEWKSFPRRSPDYLFACDEKGNWWKKPIPGFVGPPSEPIFAGKSPEPFPERAFSQFLSKKGLPFAIPKEWARTWKSQIKESVESSHVPLVWLEVRDCLFLLSEGEGSDLRGPELKELLRSVVLGDPDLKEFGRSLPGICKALWACLENFCVDYSNQGERRLRLCPGCGSYFLAAGKKRFCDPVCERLFSLPTKADKARVERAEWQQRQRRDQQRRKREKESDYKQILACLMKRTEKKDLYGHAYTEEDAQGEARRLIEKGWTYEKFLKKYE